MRDTRQPALLSSNSVAEGAAEVNRKSTRLIPESILQLQRQLDQFRSTQPRRTKPPESL